MRQGLSWYGGLSDLRAGSLHFTILLFLLSTSLYLLGATALLAPVEVVAPTTQPAVLPALGVTFPADEAEPAPTTAAPGRQLPTLGPLPPPPQIIIPDRVPAASIPIPASEVTPTLIPGTPSLTPTPTPAPEVTASAATSPTALRPTLPVALPGNPVGSTSPPALPPTATSPATLTPIPSAPTPSASSPTGGPATPTPSVNPVASLTFTPGPSSTPVSTPRPSP